METYAIANQKGGVGKTTMGPALASELARIGAAHSIGTHENARRLRLGSRREATKTAC